MALISPFELKSIGTGKDIFQKVIEYWMNATSTRFSRWLFLLSLPSLMKILIVSTAFSLVLVTNVKVVETETSFLALFWNFRDTCLSNVSSDDSWNTRVRRYLSHYYWLHWYLHLLLGSCAHNHPFSLGIKNLSGLGPSCPSGSSRWKFAGTCY